MHCDFAIKQLPKHSKDVMGQITEFETQTDFSGKVDIVSLHPLESESQIKDCVFAKGVRRSSM